MIWNSINGKVKPATWLLVLTCLCIGHGKPAWSQKLTDSQALDLIVAAVQQTPDADVQAALLEGMLQGLEGRRNLKPPAGWAQLQQQLAASNESQLKQSAQRLAQMFGDSAATETAFRIVLNRNATTDERRKALAALTAQRYQPLSAKLIELIDDPELQLPAIRATSVLPTKNVADQLLKKYRSLDPAAQRVVVETLATRKDFAAAMVRGLNSGTINTQDVPTYVARSMREIAGKSFVDAYGEVQELKQDTAATIKKYKSMITPTALAKADAGKGRMVFQKTCGACHKMYGDGGSVGPDLTGSNRANLDYLLLNSVDPSGDVPVGYRTVIVQTIDGRVLTGVIAEEDNQRVILKTVDNPRVVIAKDEIEFRKVSPKSMMPDGQLDEMKPAELLNLVKYMQTTSQVEAVK